MNLNIGTKIKKLRTERKITQEELAEKMGVSFQAVSKWETNATAPDISLLPKLALYFGISMDELFSMNADDYLLRIRQMLQNEHTISPDNFLWAERYLKATLSESPSQLDARRLLVELYAHRENRDSLAIGRLAEEGLSEDPADEDLLSRLIQTRERRDEIPRLIRFLESLLQTNPEELALRERMIDVCIRHRMFEKAETLLSAAPFKSPLLELYRGDLLLCRTNDEAAAMQIWTDTANQYNDYATHYHVGERMEKLKRYDHAIAHLKKANALSPTPKEMDALYALAFLYEHIGQIQNALFTW